MLSQLIEKVYSRFQVNWKSISSPALEWNFFSTKRSAVKKTLKYAASPEAYDNRLNSSSRKREVPSRCPKP